LTERLTGEIKLMNELWPLALAIMLSPFPIIPAILLLFTVHPRSTSSSFLAGWFSGIVVATTVFVFIGGFVEAHESTPTWIAWARIAAGLALVAYGVEHWLTRKQPKPAPKWMQSLQTATPRKAATLGFLLSAANPKIVLLAGSAGIAIGAASDSSGSTVALVLLFSVVASLSVAFPVVLYFLRGDKVLTPLGKARDWLERNNAAVMAVVIFVIGIVLAVKGVQSF
jgi:threonine/homoserine/homoserine lactone efflux protein